MLDTHFFLKKKYKFRLVGQDSRLRMHHFVEYFSVTLNFKCRWNKQTGVRSCPSGKSGGGNLWYDMITQLQLNTELKG